MGLKVCFETQSLVQNGLRIKNFSAYMESSVISISGRPWGSSESLNLAMHKLETAKSGDLERLHCVLVRYLLS